MATVLVADDKPTNREFLTTLLGYGGHRVLEAADGAAALAQVRTEHPDLVITDVLMPVMDGYEFVRQLRADPQIAGTRVIFYTASYHEREARALAESCGVHHLIVKPAEPEQILATVNQALGAALEPNEAPPPLEFDREHLRLLTDKLSANVNALEAANQRLSELLEIGRVLAAEHDSERLLDKFCPAVRALTGARFAFIGVLHEGDRVLQPLIVSGADPATTANLGTFYADRGIIAHLIEKDGPLRHPDVSQDLLETRLPPSHWSTRSFLGIGLRSSAGLYGLLWLLEKLGGAEFSEEDEQVLISLAAQAGVAYDNAQRYGEIRRHAAELECRVEELEEELNTEQRFEDIIGASTGLRRVLKQVETVSATDATVLLLGETGTGKDLVARAIHKLSSRSARTLVKLNCAAIPTGLLESELFGHERGAFTGAISQKIGRLELAHQGTLFLDEIGDLPPELQPKILRALQEKEFERLGSTRTIHVDVRLVAATNRNLEKMVADREFRSDLYYRLRVFPITIPPLRERREDIPLLAQYFVTKHARRMGKKIETIPSDVMKALTRWHWPGNVRELENFMERAVILSSGPSLYAPLAELEISGEITSEIDSTLENTEREHILRVLREARGMIGGPQGAAARLGLKRTTLNSKMKKLRIEREEYVDRPAKGPGR
jgi:transcriptional regulator with GAF, ATPase, and Fis domain/CheY-like chemotaxis protein